MRHSGVAFFKHDGKLLAAAFGRSEDPESLSYNVDASLGYYAGTTFFDVYSEKELFFIHSSAGRFYALTKDGAAIIMEAFAWPEPNADAFYNIYSVYDFNGKELIPQGSAWKDLYDAGFVDTALPLFYTWQ